MNKYGSYSDADLDYFCKNRKSAIGGYVYSEIPKVKKICWKLNELEKE